MRVGILTDQPYGAALGYSIRPKELSINLSNLGCEVYILSLADSSSKISDTLTIKGSNTYFLPIVRKFQKIAYKAFKSNITSRFLFRRKMLETLSENLAKKLYKDVKELDLDILQGEKEICGMAAVIIGKRLGIPVISDIHGLLAEEAVLCGFIGKNSKEFFEAKAFTTHLLIESNAILVVSEKLKDYFISDYLVDSNKIFVVPNAARTGRITRPKRDKVIKTAYAGILERWENVELIIKSIPWVVRGNPNAQFNIFGSGPLYKELNYLASSLDVRDNVKFFGLVPYDNIAKYLSECDIGLFPSSLDITRQVSCPLKLFEYLAIGLPVVTVEGFWWSSLVKRNRLGIVAEANPEDFGAAILQLLSDPDELNIMSDNAIRFVRTKYNWKYITDSLYDIYKAVLFNESHKRLYQKG